MNTSPKLSVILPVYNVEKYLERCLDSIINQTFKDFELLIVNDGSPDNSHLICDAYAKKDDRIKIFKKSNGGLSSARNYGLNRANGDCIAFVDSDDYLDLNMFQFMIDAILKYGTSISICGRNDVFVDGRIKAVNSFSEDTILSNQTALELLVKDESINSFAWNKIYRRELFEDIRFPDGRIYEDIAVMFKIFNKANKIVHIKDSLYFYLHNTEGISRSKGKELIIAKDLFYAHHERYQFIRDKSEYHAVLQISEKQAFLFAINYLHRMVLSKLSFTEFKNILFLAKEMNALSNKMLSLKYRLEYLFLYWPKLYLNLLMLMYKFKSLRRK